MAAVVDPDVSADPCIELAHPSDFAESMWLAWGIFFDPGADGLPPACHSDKLVLLIFSVSGFIFNLVVLGMVVRCCPTNSVAERLRNTSSPTGTR